MFHVNPPVGPVRPKENFLVFGAPSIQEEEIGEVVDTLRSRWTGAGPKVAQFERAFSAYKGAPHAAAVSSCTAGLHLSLLAAGLEPGDEVITTPLTFCATVNAIIHAGGTPVLADVDPHSMNLDPRAVEERITAKTRAILPVHFAGRPCDMDALAALAKRRNLLLIEDCAHAIEAEWKGRKVGTIGDFGCFSFYVTKNITTAEGGLVLSRSEAAIATVKTLALHGMSKDAWKRFSDDGYKHYYVTAAGFKYNMTDLQASIGLHQLKRIDRWWQCRRRLWDAYNERFSGYPIRLPPPPESETRHAFHLYTILVDPEVSGVSRDRFLEEMDRHHIGVGVHYLSIPEHPYYQQRFGWRPEAWPHARSIGLRTVSLPLSAGLSDSDVDDVHAAVRQVLRL